MSNPLEEFLRSRGKQEASDEEDPTEEVETVHPQQPPQAEVRSPQQGKVTFSNLFRHPLAHPIVLDLVLLRHYSLEWLEWEPESLGMRIEADFGGVSDVNMHKIQACRALHSNEEFWSRWEIFTWCVSAFNGIPPDFETMQVFPMHALMIAVDIANRIRDDVKWSSEVKAHMEQSLLFDGVLFPIKPLDFLSIDAASYEIDEKKVWTSWAEVLATHKVPAEETVEAEQVRRMLLTQLQYEDSKTLLREQLPLVSHERPSLLRL